MKWIGTAIKKPQSWSVYTFQGKQSFTNAKGETYEVDGEDHYILENPDTKKRWPIKKSIFMQTYSLR